MLYIKFKKSVSPLSGFSYLDSNSLELTILGRFLISEASNPQSYIDWVLDPSQDLTASNITLLEKEDDLIYISDLLEVDNNPPRFPFKKEEFIQILKDWEKVKSQNPQEILIIKENDRIMIQGFGT